MIHRGYDFHFNICLLYFTPLQYSCLENPMDWGAWWAAVHGVAESRTQLSHFTFTFHFHTLEKEMATHSSVLAWRIPGTGEPGGLPSLGSQSRTRLKRPSSSSSSSSSSIILQSYWKDFLKFPLQNSKFYLLGTVCLFVFTYFVNGFISVTVSYSCWKQHYVNLKYNINSTSGNYTIDLKNDRILLLHILC